MGSLRAAVPVEGDVDEDVRRVRSRVEQHAVVVGACGCSVNRLIQLI